MIASVPKTEDGKLKFGTNIPEYIKTFRSKTGINLFISTPTVLEKLIHCWENRETSLFIFVLPITFDSVKIFPKISESDIR